MPTALRMTIANVIVALSFVACAPLFAQTGTATLSGVIQDPKGGVVADVEVVATRIETGTSVMTRTNGAGIYVFTGLMSGHYHLVLHKPGFKEIAIKEFELHVQDKLEQNFSLEIGSVSETVTVDANNEHMATDNPAVGILVNRDFIENTPLNGRSLQDLIALAPGAVNSSQNFGNGLFSINGQHDDSNYFTVDGVSANTDPGVNGGPSRSIAGSIPSQTALGTTQSLSSLDSLQEFKIQTSGYTAEFGRQPGGQVELTTRSGTNRIHGSVFDYFRNDVLDANSWFFNTNAIPKQPKRQNDFGGTVGGPVEIPGLYNGKDRTFYFVSYEGLRLREPSFASEDVPTMAFRQFVGSGWQPFFNATPLPNGPDNGDQCAASLAPNNPAYAFSCTAQFKAAYGFRNSLDSFNVRVDQVIGQKIEIFFRYADNPSQTGNNFPGSIVTTTTNSNSWTVGMTGRLTASLLDELRFNHTSNGGHFSTVPAAFDGSIPYARALVIPGQYAGPNTPALGAPGESLPNSNFFSIPQYDLFVNRQEQLNLVDGISWTKRAHTLKFGGDYRRLTPLYNQEQYTSVFNAVSALSLQQDSVDMVFLRAAARARPVFSNLSLYAEDHWKVTPNLTLDYGLRWEFDPPPGAIDGVYPLALTTGNLATAQIAPPRTQQYHTIYHDFAPRLGFAYQAAGGHNRPLVIRGGIGIFYDTGQALGAAGYAAYPFLAQSTLTNVTLPASASALAPPSLNFPLLPPYPFISGISDPNLRVPYVEQWNLSLDKALNPRNNLTISYVGNEGKHLLFQELDFNLSAINPLFTNLFLSTNAASSNYNALQVQDQGFIAPGMQLLTSYTWAHAIDNASIDTTTTSPLRGNSDNDVRQVLNAALNYRVPETGSGGFKGALRNGWSLDGRITAETGYPIDVNQGQFVELGSFLNIRPDLARGVPIYLHDASGSVNGWALNPAAFVPVPLNPDGSPTRVGNLGRNFIHGANFWNVNLAVQRNFRLYEPLHLVFRVEAFNVLNHANSGAIDSCLCDSTFGKSLFPQTLGVPNQLYASGAARSLQLMLKLQF